MAKEEFQLKVIGTWGEQRTIAWEGLRSFIEAHGRLRLAIRIDIDQYSTAVAETVESST